MDEQWKAALTPWKEKMDELQRKDRRCTLDEVVSFFTGDDEDESRLPIRPRKLRPFSGSKHVGSGEIDYDTWRLHALAVVDNLGLQDADKKRVIIESLLSHALEIACSLKVTCTAKEIVEILDQHFGDVADGYELYSQFRAAVQGMQESASDYLHRLHMLALRAAERGGMSSSCVPKEVLRQFESNCADDDLLFRIGVRDMFASPPAVSKLLRDVRVEESRRHEKKFRLKARHACANVVTACEVDMTAQIQTLQQQVDHLNLQLQTQSASTSPGATGVSMPAARRGNGDDHCQGQQSRRGRRRSNGRGSGSTRRSTRFGFCFHCGQEGHYQAACCAQKNPELVQQKLLTSTQRSATTLPENS